jgi:O-acetyl-ADP-ribose deacetylase (regulator of RNase III)
MIEYRKGNLLDVEEGIIAHGCNSYGVMGSGVALAVKNMYPEAFIKYQIYCQNNQDTDITGSTVCVTVTPELVVANMITQEDFGRNPATRYVSYDAIDDCFKYVNSVFLDTTINIPKIGAGLGNGKWEVIAEIINHRCSGREVICWEL